MEKFKTLFYVKASLICLYMALTAPIPFISNKDLKLLSILAFIFGLILIINITYDYVEICDKKISYQTTYLSKLFGKKGWVIFWKDIRRIKTLPTSQGSKVHYFITNQDESFLVPQRVENFEKFISIISIKTNLKIDELSYLSPIWTYKLLTYLSLSMLIGEIIAFSI